MKGRTGGLEMVMLLKARVIGGRVMNAGSGRKQEAVGSGQIYIHSVRQCDCKYDFIDEERPREVEILAQGHTAKQRQSKARKADFCILKSSHTHTHTRVERVVNKPRAPITYFQQLPTPGPVPFHLYPFCSPTSGLFQSRSLTSYHFIHKYFGRQL